MEQQTYRYASPTPDGFCEIWFHAELKNGELEVTKLSEAPPYLTSDIAIVGKNIQTNAKD